MKHIFVKLFALVAALSLLLALTGCGSKTTGGNSTVSSTPEPTPAGTPAPTPTAAPVPAAGGAYASLEEYWADPDNREAFENGFAAGFGADDGSMTSSFEVEGNTMICTFQFTDAGGDYTGLGEVLDAAMDGSASLFISAAGALDDEVGAEEGSCVLQLRYLDPAGNLLSEKSYTATDEPPELPEAAVGSYATLEEFWAEPGVREQIEGQMAAMGSDQLEVVSVEVSGNVLAVTLQITDPSLMVDGIADLLEQGLEGQAAIFEQEAATLDSVITDGASTVLIRYLDPDGALLIEKEFTAG